MYPPIVAAGFALVAANLVLMLRPRPGGKAPSTKDMPTEILVKRIIVANTNLLTASLTATLLSSGAAMLGVLPIWIAIPGFALSAYYAIDTAMDVFKFHRAMAHATKVAGKPSTSQVDLIEMTVQTMLALLTVPAIIWAGISLLG